MNFQNTPLWIFILQLTAILPPIATIGTVIIWLTKLKKPVRSIFISVFALYKANRTYDYSSYKSSVVGHLMVVDEGPSSLVPGLSFELASESTIGRSPTDTIPLRDNFISIQHTRLWKSRGTWYVQDAGSTNGTYVNNIPARDPLPARLGDIIQVGFIRFKLTA
jgi:FHA domain